jgi:hypothetical protein
MKEWHSLAIGRVKGARYCSRVKEDFCTPLPVKVQLLHRWLQRVKVNPSQRLPLHLPLVLLLQLLLPGKLPVCTEERKKTARELYLRVGKNVSDPTAKYISSTTKTAQHSGKILGPKARCNLSQLISLRDGKFDSRKMEYDILLITIRDRQHLKIHADLDSEQGLAFTEYLQHMKGPSDGKFANFDIFVLQTHSLRTLN